MNDARTVALHIGAHKTGTTFIQSHLQMNRKFLESQSIGLLGPRDLRSRDFWLFRQSDRQPVRRMLNDEHGWAKRLIISDENLPGTITQAVRYGRFYWQAGNALRRFADHAEGLEIECFIGVRTPDEFIVSCFCEYILTHGYLPFEEFCELVSFNSFTWLEHVETVASSLAPHLVRVIEFDTFRSGPFTVAPHIAHTKLPVDDVEGYADRVSISGTSVKSLDAKYQESGVRADQAQVVDAFYANPRTHGDKFDPWTNEESESLQNRYRADLRAIGELPNVTFVESNR